MTDARNQRLPPGQQLVAPGKWPIIGERAPRDGRPTATLTLSGLATGPRVFEVNQLSQFPQTEVVMDIHCVTRWSMLDVSVRGIRLADFLEHCQVSTVEWKFISFISNSERRHSSSLPLQVALDQQTILATHVGGRSLPLEHGGPVRNIVPGRYFYKSVKWLNEMELLRQDRLGFWEAESGYHNDADPWLEQRYMAPNIDRRLAAQLIESRDFSGRELRSIDASQRDLNGLRARDAQLRDANFRSTQLVAADFARANLSNAHFEMANLQNASFEGADLEGANLCGADLRGANLTGASLIGCSFLSEQASAVIDATTILPWALTEPLAPEQIKFLQSRIARH